jgi:hypothetical protein
MALAQKNKDLKNNNFSSLILTNGYQIISLILLISGIIYTYCTRPTTDIIKYSSYASIGFAFLISFIVFMAWVGSHYKKLTASEVIIVLLFIVAAAIIFGISFYSSGVPLKDFFLWLLKPSVSKNKTAFFAVLGTLILGGLLFFWRLRFRAIYGLTEAIVGLWVAAYRVSFQELSLDKISSYMAILTAAVYLVVRGFDNIHQGIYKDPKDRAAIWLFRKNEILAKFVKGNKNNL